MKNLILEEITDILQTLSENEKKLLVEVIDIYKEKIDYNSNEQLFELARKRYAEKYSVPYNWQS